jgi:muramoyltetrapeptide carboxypeptidase
MSTNKITQLPARLKTGDKIGIVAPAGPFEGDAFEQGLKLLEEMGFEIYVPEGLLDARGYLAGTDEHRAEVVNRLFADESIDGLICARGGYGSLRILPMLDYDTIAKNPKILAGFSDITALLTVLFDRCGLVTFHGPVVTSLADAHELTISSLFETITSDGKLEIEVSNGATLQPGTASGIMCGGNLATLCHLVGTPFAPSFTGKILFLEDRAEPPYKIDRMLKQMQLAGCFEGIAGIVLGSFEDCGPVEDLFRIIKDIFANTRVPILGGMDSGHGSLNLTLPMGVEATLDADLQVLTYRQAATTG